MRFAGALGLLLAALFLAFGALVTIPFDEVVEGPRPVYKIGVAVLALLAFIAAATLGRAALRERQAVSDHDE